MKKIISFISVLILIPTVIILGYLFFGAKKYVYISMMVALISCVPFFVGFEKQKNNTAKCVMVAVLIAFSVLGRLIFAVIPGFKPVTAIVILTGIYLGSNSGFLTGSLTALISNFYFEQGAWTPFQMFSWGIIGFLSGILSKRLKTDKVSLSLFGALGGILFSLLMDVWTTIWADGVFNASRYIAYITSALPMTLEYAVSNVIFLLILCKPMGSLIDRLSVKYDLQK